MIGTSANATPSLSAWFMPWFESDASRWPAQTDLLLSVDSPCRTTVTERVIARFSRPSTSLSYKSLTERVVATTSDESTLSEIAAT